ncbi:MAG: exodeoxyribonuclease VII small subunit [Thiothrix nivea]|nr:MAG: exodeoxyribonuclease VII small subunit [Thiothrix nivea]
MAELEALVQRMESGELSLEDSLREFERGVQLTRLCQEQLQAAEQRVRILTADGKEEGFVAERTE